jgi:hypothetical protein
MYRTPTTVSMSPSLANVRAFPLSSYFPTINLLAVPLFTPTNTPLIPTPAASPKSELVLFVGYPCLGKSYFYRSHFEPVGYKHVNQDTLKTRDKCVTAVEQALSAGESCVVGGSRILFSFHSS